MIPTKTPSLSPNRIPNSKNASHKYKTEEFTDQDNPEYNYDLDDSGNTLKDFKKHIEMNR